MKDFKDAIARMSKLDPRIFDGHLDFIWVTSMTDVNREAEIMRRLKTVGLRDETEKSKKLLVEPEEKERKERERLEFIEVNRCEKEEKARKLEVLSKKHPSTQEDLIRLQQMLLLKKPKKKKNNSWM